MITNDERSHGARILWDKADMSWDGCTSFTLKIPALLDPWPVAWLNVNLQSGIRQALDSTSGLLAHKLTAHVELGTFNPGGYDRESVIIVVLHKSMMTYSAAKLLQSSVHQAIDEAYEAARHATKSAQTYLNLLR